MSTQSAPRIRFTQTAPQQSFRLLELPPELAEVLSAKDAPTLYLKSSSSTGPNAVDKDNYVNLCTLTKTYRVRQVQSSNSIHLLAPSPAERVRLLSGKISSDVNGLDGVDTISAIAKCSSTLELQSLSETEEVDIARRLLEDKLRVYDRLSVDAVGEDTVMRDEGEDLEEGHGVSSGSGPQRESEGVIRNRILNEVPMCATRCRAVWRELCGFVATDLRTGTGLVAYRPSARVRLDVWKRIQEGSVLEGIDLGKLFLVNDLWKAVLTEDGEEPFPRELFNAVVRRVAEPTGSNDDDAELRWVNLDMAIVVRFVGETYLEATAPTERSLIGRTEFLAAWKDLLPEGWRDQVSLDKIQGSYNLPDPISIYYHRQSEVTKAASSSGATVKNARNWHERFKAQRK